MLPKKKSPLVRAETACCILAAIIIAGCLAHHPDSDHPLIAVLVLLVAANVLQIVRDRKRDKEQK